MLRERGIIREEGEEKESKESPPHGHQSSQLSCEDGGTEVWEDTEHSPVEEEGEEVREEEHFKPIHISDLRRSLPKLRQTATSISEGGWAMAIAPCGTVGCQFDVKWGGWYGTRKRL